MGITIAQLNKVNFLCTVKNICTNDHLGHPSRQVTLMYKSCRACNHGASGTVYEQEAKP